MISLRGVGNLIAGLYWRKERESRHDEQERIVYYK